VLAEVARRLTGRLRVEDHLGRFGGEEFLVLLPDTDHTGALEVAEKIRHAIEQTEMPVIGTVTGSLGVAALPEDAVEPDQLIRKADRALYAAKARGRNRVEVSRPSGAEELRSDDDRLGGPGDVRGES
jgi:diguanylate cyclase (GGDEF)-like protein